MFLGEIDDLAAALEHVKARPDVDPDQIYVAGHSTGGTVALLISAMSDIPAGVVSFGGAPDIVSVMRSGGYDSEPFDRRKLDECRFRSPHTFAEAMDVPTLFIEGAENEGYTMDALRLADSVPDDKLTVCNIRGENHFSVLHPMY